MERERQSHRLDVQAEPEGEVQRRHADHVGRRQVLAAAPQEPGGERVLSRELRDGSHDPRSPHGRRDAVAARLGVPEPDVGDLYVRAQLQSGQGQRRHRRSQRPQDRPRRPLVPVALGRQRSLRAAELHLWPAGDYRREPALLGPQAVLHQDHHQADGDGRQPGSVAAERRGQHRHAAEPRHGGEPAGPERHHRQDDPVVQRALDRHELPSQRTSTSRAR